MKVLTFYDGETEAIDAFADVIRYKIRQRIRDRKNLNIVTYISLDTFKEAHFLYCGETGGCPETDKQPSGIPSHV